MRYAIKLPAFALKAPDVLRKITIKARLGFLIVLMSLGMIQVGFLGLNGMRSVESGLESVYSDQLLPSQQIGTINDLMRADIEALYKMALLDPRLNGGEADMDAVADYVGDIEANIEFTGQLWDAYMKTDRSSEEQSLARAFQEARQTYLDEGLMPAVRLFESGDFAAGVQQLEETIRLYEDAAFASQDLLSLQIEDAKKIYEGAQKSYGEMRSTTLVGSAVGVLVAIVIGLLIIRAIVRPAKHAAEIFERIGQGQLDSEIKIKADDEMGRILSNLRDMQQRLSERLEVERRQAAENRRIRDALEAVSGAVMIADPSLGIIHVNPAARRLFSDHEEAFRRDLPDFGAEAIVGSKIDVFHRDPERVREILANLTESYSETIVLGGRTLRLITSPVFNDEGERLGYVVEWEDRTEQVDAERDVEAIVAAAAEGDFARRMDVSKATGFFRVLGESVNKLMDVTDRNLKEVVRVLECLARGDLTERVEGEFSGAFAQLQQSTNDSIEQLEQLIGQVRTAGDAIAGASSEIAAGNTNLSQRTEEQAASLEETASSMEEMTTTVKQNADNARQANQLAQGARDVANKGGEKVREVISSMNAITESARKIENIISVIDGIAFQTNILALNAAVEAARAGEQGRGFAVVAGEVRTLAQRSAEAAKEIKALITDSVRNVENGSSLVEDAGRTMEEIVNAIKRVTDIMSEISAASVEQSQGIEQVNATITQLDEMTQQNAALVEQATAAAGAMEEQARLLMHAVSVFRMRAGAESEGEEGLQVPVADDGSADERSAGTASKRGKRRKPAAASNGREPSPRVDTVRKLVAAPAVTTTGDDEWTEF
ncbi:MAG TPA: methyl-accepting chemotaxis protein [Gammaproteobacteria bacterium]